MKHPRHLLTRRAWAARAEDRLPLGQNFSLHEQIAKRAMGQVGIQRGQHNFSVTCHLDMTSAGRQVGERDTADLNVVFRRNTDLGMRFDGLIATPVFSPRLHENRLVVIGLRSVG